MLRANTWATNQPASNAAITTSAASATTVAVFREALAFLEDIGEVSTRPVPTEVRPSYGMATALPVTALPGIP
jgi:hypothetical protein